MSLTKRLEKEIDYKKTLLSILIALVVGLTTWFVNTNNETSLFFQIASIVLFLIFVFGIINQHKGIKVLLDKLEEAND